MLRFENIVKDQITLNKDYINVTGSMLVDNLENLAKMLVKVVRMFSVSWDAIG